VSRACWISFRDSLRRRIVVLQASILLFCAVAAALAQSSPYGLIAIKPTNGPEGIEQKPTTTRLFILGPTNQYNLPLLRLAMTDKPFMAGRLSLLEGSIVIRSKETQAFRIPLVTNRFPQTAYAQIVDVPITPGPVTDMLVAIFNSPAGATVGIGVVDADSPSLSKSYIVPAPAIQDLKKQYIRVKTAK
jgi:hypothetical protein